MSKLAVQLLASLLIVVFHSALGAGEQGEARTDFLSFCPGCATPGSSSEGAEQSISDLSLRRAEAVVAALIEPGLVPTRLSAAGCGEDDPIAGDDDAAGRSLNRWAGLACGG